MKTKNRIVSLILILAMVLGAIPAYAAQASAEIPDGVINVAEEPASVPEILEADGAVSPPSDIVARCAQIASEIRNSNQTASVQRASDLDTENALLNEELNGKISINVPDNMNSLLTPASSAFSARDAEGRTVYGTLPNIGDTAQFTIETALPEVTLYAFCRGATGDVRIQVLEENKVIKTLKLFNRSIGYCSTYWPKIYGTIENPTGESKTYTVKMSTETGNASFAITVGTRDTFIEDYGGGNYATAAKNIPSDLVADTEDVGWFPGASALLNSGEVFHYVADGFTYITVHNSDDYILAFIVYDIEADQVIYNTTLDDCVVEPLGEGVRVSYVEKGLDLVPGKEYLISIYSVLTITPDLDDFYGIRIGLPTLILKEITNGTTSAYSIPANKMTHFTFDISGFPESARAGMTMIVAFNTANTVRDLSINYCVITDPHGNKFIPETRGRYTKFKVDPIDFWGRHNTPLNGRWTVDIKSSESLSGLKFRMLYNYMRIAGPDGD